MRREEFVMRAVDLYTAATGRLEVFFAAFTSGYCARCLDLHREFNPDDPISRHELVSGVFPGCCQEGVAQDLRIGAFSGERLPPWLAEELLARRPAPPASGPGVFRVRDSADGSVHEGRGCAWLGPYGCSLGALKSPICVFYVCEPVRAALFSRSGQAFGEGDDFLGFSSFLRVLAGVDPETPGSLCDAELALVVFLERVEAFSAGFYGDVNS